MSCALFVPPLLMFFLNKQLELELENITNIVCIHFSCSSATDYKCSPIMIYMYRQ